MVYSTGLPSPASKAMSHLRSNSNRDSGSSQWRGSGPDRWLFPSHNVEKVSGRTHPGSGMLPVIPYDIKFLRSMCNARSLPLTHALPKYVQDLILLLLLPCRSRPAGKAYYSHGSHPTIHRAANALPRARRPRSGWVPSIQCQVAR